MGSADRWCMWEKTGTISRPMLIMRAERSGWEPNRTKHAAELLSHRLYQPSSPRLLSSQAIRYYTTLPPPSPRRSLLATTPAPPLVMASAAGRKKSVISATTPTIESPIANNTLLNKAASQSTSLYQQCSALRTRLLQVQDFPEWFTVSSPPDSSRRSTDPVTQLWDCFALGVPLCYLFNLLPAPFSPINIDTDPKSFDATNEKTKKRSIALFSMQIKQLEGCEQFTVTELWDRNSTDGFVKVRCSRG